MKGSNGVKATGAYVSGQGTLSKSTTHAPDVGSSKGNFSGTKSNGVCGGSPSGGITFQGKSHDAAPFDARKAAGQAHSLQTSKSATKVLTSKSTSGFKGEATAGAHPKAENYSNGLKSTYGK